MPETTGIIVFGHGSSVPSANEAVMRVAAQAAEHAGWKHYETAFLECSPTLQEAVASLVRQGVRDVLVLPYFLTLGIHLQRDLPRLVDRLSSDWGVTIRVTPPLDGHPELSLILVDRARDAARETAP